MDLHGTQEESTADVAEGQQWMLEQPEHFVVWGTALLVRTEFLQRIGGLDEHLFMYYEDYDLSYRAWVAGYRKVVVPEVVVLHEEKDFSGLMKNIKPHYFYYWFRNFILLRRKHGGILRRARPIWWKVFRALELRHRIREQTELADAILMGLWHGALNRGGVYPDQIRVPRLFRVAMDAVTQGTVLRRARAAGDAPPS